MIVVDCEFSGLNPFSNNIISLGAIDMNNPSNQFYGECRIDDDSEIEEVPMWPGIQPVKEYFGMSEEDFRDPKKQSTKELLEKFLEWLEPIEDITVCGSAPWVDLMFINAACFKHGLKNPLGHRGVDISTTGYIYYVNNNLEIPVRDKKASLGLGSMSKFVGLKEEPVPHNALNGAKWCAEVYSRLVFGKKLIPDFEKFDIPDTVKH